MIDPSGWPTNPRAAWSQVVSKTARTLIMWKSAEYDDAIAHEERQQILLAIDGVKPTRTRATRPDPGALEKNGAAALTDERKAPKRPWVVRVYYISEGDEQCYAEFGGLTEPESGALVNRWTWALPPTRFNAATKKWEGGKPAQPLPQSWPVLRPDLDEPPPAPVRGWKKVVFPSERRERPEVLP